MHPNMLPTPSYCYSNTAHTPLYASSIRSQTSPNSPSLLPSFKHHPLHPRPPPPQCPRSNTQLTPSPNQIDGHTSPLLQTLHVPSLPLTSPTSASFHPNGTSLLLTGPRPFFFVHDLQSGAITRKALRPNPSATGAQAEGMELTAFSHTAGEILAVGARGGYVHLVDWKSGAGQVVGSLKCGGLGGVGGGGVKDMWWVPPGEGRAREHLAVLTGDAEVYLWDVGERRCVRRWRDEGGFRGAARVMTGSAAGARGGWLGVGCVCVCFCDASLLIRPLIHNVSSETARTRAW
jgi:U3 small nucleolar RNA-associated protein 18